MDYQKFCERCQHYQFNLEEGILCGLTHQKPSFEESCDKFELDPLKDQPPEKYQHSSVARSKDVSLPDMEESLQKWGIALIILGIIHIVFSGFLDAFWGGLIIILGIFNLTIKKRGMFIANGSGLMMVGVMNILETIALQGSGFMWLVIGVFQIGWGIAEIRKFSRYGVEETTSLPEKAEVTPEEQKEHHVPSLYPHSGLGLSSFIVALVTLFLQISLFIYSTIQQISDPYWLERTTFETSLVGFLMSLSFFLIIISIGLGIAGVFQKQRRKLFGVLGLLVDVGLILLWIFLLAPAG
ncbi:MAG: hypothetical protein D6732_12315 [Methanobacteriota archaeon]|nr:MAG: hypothetical protein D6732_12315 [Euryarchaeota archaeon]